MSKREKTSIPNVYRSPSGMLYYRKGDDEFSLDTKDEAEARDAKLIFEVKSKAFGSQAFKVRMQALVPKFLKHCEESGEYRERTLEQIKYLLEIPNDKKSKARRGHLTKFFGKYKMADIDESLWLSYTKTKIVSDFMNHRMVMNLFLKWARENKYYLYRPEFSIPKHKRRVRRNLTPDQIKLLFTHAENELLLLATLMLLHQMRGNEAETILLEKINFDKKFVELTPEKDKNKRGRIVTLNDFALELIKQQIERVKSRGVKSPWLFPNKKDPKRHVSRLGYRKQWFRVQEKAEGQLEGLQWHDFRATGEKHAHKSKDFTDTQREKFAGSSTEVQKRRYVQMDAEDVRGLENAVQIEGLTEIIRTKLHADSPKGSGK